MATPTIRNLDEDLKARLRIAAAANDRSMEEEVRVILRRALSVPAQQTDLGQRIHKRFAALGLSELDMPARRDPARAADFQE